MTLTALQCRMARAALELSIRELARQAGLSPGTISRFEGGQPPGAPRLRRLHDTIVGLGIILLPEEAGEGVGIRLGRDFRKQFLFDAEGRQVAAIVGGTVIDVLGGQPVGTVRGEDVFALSGETLGTLQGVDVIAQAGSLPGPGLRALQAASHGTAAGERPGADLLLDG